MNKFKNVLVTVDFPFLMLLLNSLIEVCLLSFFIFREEETKLGGLPDDLITRIIVDYLPDQIGNRLISKRIKFELDRKYKKICGLKEFYPTDSKIILLEAQMRLKATDRSSRQRISFYLSDPSVEVSRMCVKLMRSKNLVCSISAEVIMALLMRSSNLEEFKSILKIGAKSLLSLAGDENLSLEQVELMKLKYQELKFQDDLEKYYIISYSAGMRLH